MHFLVLFCPGLPSSGTYMQGSDDIISTMAPVNGPITHYAPPYLNSCWDEVRSISLFNMFQISQLVLRDLVINSNVSLPWISQSSGQTWIQIPCSIRDNVGSESYKMDWIFVIHDSKGSSKNIARIANADSIAVQVTHCTDCRSHSLFLNVMIQVS